MTTDTSTIDRLAEVAIDAFHAAELAHWQGQPAATRGPAPEVNEDDCAMLVGSADDLFAWVDDLEYRVGLDVTDMRAAVLDYVAARDGSGGCPDLDEYIANNIRNSED